MTTVNPPERPSYNDWAKELNVGIMYDRSDGNEYLKYGYEDYQENKNNTSNITNTSNILINLKTKFKSWVKEIKM